MIKPKTVAIPVAEIRVVNPRSRNQVTFNAIKASIASVGLKKPITVHQRALEEDGTRYDLVCGQGRLESVRDLGDEVIDAIINDAPEDERYVMSLVENLARRSPCTTDLLREVKRLNAQHYKPAVIAEKLGMDKSYIYGIVHLLRHGEEDLIIRVESGRLPIDTAIKLATGGDADIQRALSEAYENGTLRGAKLRAVQQLVIRRKGAKSMQVTKRPLTSADLVRTYEHHTQQQRALVRRSALITQRLAILTSSLRRLLADDHLLTLLRAEGLRSIPDFLTTRVGARDGEPVCQ
jgi:ParB family transcriptional regulator, chromosome partitioning protein